MPSFQKTIIVSPTYPGYPHSIQDGIRKLNGQPGVVLVESGEYDITSPGEVIRIPDKTTVMSFGGATVNLKVPLTTALVMNTGNNRMAFEGIDLKVCHEAITYSENLVFFKNTIDSRIARVNVTTEDEVPIVPPGDHNVPILPAGVIKSGVAILLFAQNGYSLRNVIEACCVTNYNAIAYYMATGPGEIQYGCKDNTIQGCKAARCFCGCGLMSASDNAILNNSFTYATGFVAGHDGILLQLSNSNRIIGNSLSLNGEHGLYLSGSKENIIQGNQCNDNYSAGIHVRFFSAEDMPIDDSGNVFMGNPCYRNGVGIHLQEYANHNTLIGNTCAYNVHDGFRVHLTGATANTIDGNQCYGNGDNQMSIETNGNFIGTNPS